MAPNLDWLPTEILICVLSFLPVSDLHQLTRTSRRLRRLACDPLLHLHRLHNASHMLSIALANRPSKSMISPPNAWIWLSKTNILSRSINKSLTKIRLAHNLEHRPSAVDLVARAILPSICTCYSSSISPVLIQSQQAVAKSRLKDGLERKLERRPSVNDLVSLNILPEECFKRSISPALVATRRRVIKERLKDGLRVWVEGRAIAAQKKADELDATEKRDVKALVRRFANTKPANELDRRFDSDALEKRRARERWGRQVQTKTQKDDVSKNGACLQPTRAHVLGLKRFWEGVIRAAAG